MRGLPAALGNRCERGVGAAQRREGRRGGIREGKFRGTGGERCVELSCVCL